MKFTIILSGISLVIFGILTLGLIWGFFSDVELYLKVTTSLIIMSGVSFFVSAMMNYYRTKKKLKKDKHIG